MKAWRIAHWAESHESAESRKLTQPWWVPKPNKHDGMAFCLIAVEEDNFALYGAWSLILETASRGPKDTRGWLIRNGRPLDCRDLMVMTRFPKAGFERAFEFFSKREIGWLKQEEYIPYTEPGQGPGQGPAASPGLEQATLPVQEDRKTGRQEGKRSEEEGRARVVPNAKGPSLREQFAACQAQVRDLEARKDDLSQDELAVLKKKRRRLRLIQEAQASGQANLPAEVAA